MICRLEPDVTIAFPGHTAIIPPPSWHAPKGPAIIVGLDVRSPNWCRIVDAAFVHDPLEAIREPSELAKLAERVIGAPAMAIVTCFDLDVLTGTGWAIQICESAFRGALWGHITAPSRNETPGYALTNIGGRLFTGPMQSFDRYPGGPGIYVICDQVGGHVTPLAVEFTPNLAPQFVCEEPFAEIGHRIYGEPVVYVSKMKAKPEFCERELPRVRGELIGPAGLATGDAAEPAARVGLPFTR